MGRCLWTTPVWMLVCLAVVGPWPASLAAQPDPTEHRLVQVTNSGSGPLAGATDAPIRAAVEQLPAGGTVLVGPGAYVIRRPIRLPSGTTLRGAEAATTILRLPPPTLTAAAASLGAETIAVVDAAPFAPDTVLQLLPPGNDRSEKLEFTAQRATIRAIEGNRLTLAAPLAAELPQGSRVGYAHHLIDLRGPLENVTVADLTLQGGRTTEIPMPGHAERCGLWAVSPYTYAGGPQQQPLRGLAIRNCTIEDFYGRAVALYNVAESEVRDCRIARIDDEAIDLDHFARHCRAEQNIIREAHVGVTLNDASHCVVRRNQITACGSGIRLWWWHMVDPQGVNRHNTIEQNVIRAARDAAIYLGPHAQQNVVRDNALDGPLQVAEPEKNTVENNRPLPAGDEVP